MVGRELSERVPVEYALAKFSDEFGDAWGGDPGTTTAAGRHCKRIFSHVQTD
jgi:hypothetical protein